MAWVSSTRVHSLIWARRLLYFLFGPMLVLAFLYCGFRYWREGSAAFGHGSFAGWVALCALFSSVVWVLVFAFFCQSYHMQETREALVLIRCQREKERRERQKERETEALKKSLQALPASSDQGLAEVVEQ